MCILCDVQRWSWRVATMLPWLVLSLILLWAHSQLEEALSPLLPDADVSPRLAFVAGLLQPLLWFKILLPRFSVWRVLRSARLREERRAHALELKKLRKTATRRCCNCNNPYRDQNPGGGKFMCSYCGHVSKRPVLDLGSAGKVPSGWPCSQDWANAAGDPGYWLDLRCSADNSYSGFSWRLFSCFYVSMASFWRKVLRFGSSGDGGGLGRDGKMLAKGGENGGKAEESRVDKAKRKAEEKRLARLEREMLEEEERKQREEMAKLVEERRRLRDEKAEAEERSKGATPVGEKDARKEAERRRQERRRKEDKGSSKSNSDCEDIERRVSREGEWKRDFDRRNEPDRHDATRVGTEGYKPHNFEASSQGGKTVQSRTKYFGRMTGGLLSSSRGFSGGSIFGRSAQTPAPQANKVTKPLVTATDQVGQRFQELFSQPKYKEAAELAVEFPQDLLRTPETIAKFKSAPLQLGQASPLLQYFATLLAQGKLNAYESLELSRLAINQNGKNLLEGWLADDKLECSEELGNLVKTVDDDLALKIFIRARDNPRVVAAFNERAEFDNIIIHTKQRENASALKGPGEINYKVYDGEGSIFSSNFNSGPSSEMADLASEIEALERILSDASAQPTKLSYALIKSVTNNFSKVIGRGGFAVVYQGFLQNGKIAVKKLSLSNGFSDELFVDEIECLTKAKHNNVVRYLGYCADTQGELMEFNGRCVIAEVPKRLLCFEFVPNGSLHRYLKAKPCGDEWQVRYKIIKGICQGLQYLHKIRINHLDLKPGNILLGVGMEPKIADFGLSRCFDEEQSRVFTKHIYGTRGYIAPEIINSGEISFKSDIFALGIIIIKLLTGHNDYDIENWHKSLNADCPQVRRCIEIAQACVDDDQHKRPAISEIIHKLDELETIVDSPAIN